MLWLLLVGFVIIIYLPFAMRSWRAFFTLCIVYIIIEICVRFGVATFAAADVPRFLVLAGNTWIDVLVKALPVTVIARAVVLAAKSLGLNGRKLIAANIIGMLALPGGFAGIAAYERWDRRPAPAHCTNRPIPLVLSGVTAMATWNKGVTLYVGKNIRDDGRYLHSSRNQRRICRDTSDGTENLTVEAISISTRYFSFDRCTAEDIALWERTVCDNRRNRDWRRAQHEVIIFNPDGIRLGAFGIPSSPTDYDFQVGDDEQLVSVTGGNHGAFTAVCRVPPNSDHPLFCQVHRPIVEGISLYWEANAQRANIEGSLRRADDLATSVCLSVFGHSFCDSPHKSLP